MYVCGYACVRMGVCITQIQQLIHICQYLICTLFAANFFKL